VLKEAPQCVPGAIDYAQTPIEAAFVFWFVTALRRRWRPAEGSAGNGRPPIDLIEHRLQTLFGGKTWWKNQVEKPGGKTRWKNQVEKPATDSRFNQTVL